MSNSYLDGMSSTEPQQEKDRELLKLAAYAAEMNIEEGNLFPRITPTGAVIVTPWNPLENLDHALELAAKLDMTISYGAGSVCVTYGQVSGKAAIHLDVASTTEPVRFFVCSGS